MKDDNKFTAYFEGFGELEGKTVRVELSEEEHSAILTAHVRGIVFDVTMTANGIDYEVSTDMIRLTE